MIDKKIVYTLGNGNWPWLDIPEEFRAPSILRRSRATDASKFVPLELFDGSLEEAFRDYGNWKAWLERGTAGDRFMVQPVASLQRCGLKYQAADVEQLKDVTMVHRVNEQFRFFRENQKKLFFIMDFHAGMCRKYENRQLLAFERYLDEHGFDLRNFAYISNTLDTGAVRRFAGSRIRSFVYDVALHSKFAEGKSFHNTKCLFNVDRNYVMEQVDRLAEVKGSAAVVPVVYSLGSGCWCDSAIPENLHAPSIFKNGGGYVQDKFVPQYLFSGEMEKAFFDPKNWKCGVSRGNTLVDQTFFNMQADLIPAGMRFGHFNKGTFPFNDRQKIAILFDFFKKNSKRLLFIVDFTRGSYRGCSNEQLLAFERSLVGGGYDMRNFIYVDVAGHDVPDRFSGVKAASFEYGADDVEFLENGNFKAVKKMFAVEKQYVLEQVRRISGNPRLSY